MEVTSYAITSVGLKFVFADGRELRFTIAAENLMGSSALPLEEVSLSQGTSALGGYRYSRVSVQAPSFDPQGSASQPSTLAAYIAAAFTHIQRQVVPGSPTDPDDPWQAWGMLSPCKPQLKVTPGWHLPN